MRDVQYTFHKVADYEEAIGFHANGIAVVEVKGRKICLARTGGQLFAFPLKCPHAAGLLANGWIDAKGNVVCPLHQYKFSMATGRNVTGEGYAMKCWPVERRGEEIWVGQESGGLFGWG